MSSSNPHILEEDTSPPLSDEIAQAIAPFRQENSVFAGLHDVDRGRSNPHHAYRRSQVLPHRVLSQRVYEANIALLNEALDIRPIRTTTAHETPTQEPAFTTAAQISAAFTSQLQPSFAASENNTAISLHEMQHNLRHPSASQDMMSMPLLMPLHVADRIPTLPFPNAEQPSVSQPVMQHFQPQLPSQDYMQRLNEPYPSSGPSYELTPEETAFVQADIASGPVEAPDITAVEPAVSGIGTVDIVPQDTSFPSNPRKRSRPVSPGGGGDTGDEAAPNDEESDDDSQNCCTICYEPWEKHGKHRLVCLPCGHLLGQSCAKEWLTLKKVCPMCKLRATYKQVRVIFGVPSRLRVVEHPELDKLRDELTKEKDNHKATQQKYQDMRKQLKACEAKLSVLEANQMSRIGVITDTSGRRGTMAKPSSLGEPAGDSQGVLATAVQTVAEGAGASSTSAPLSLLRQILTGGESTAFTFDDTGHVIFSEKSPSRSFSVSRLKRVAISMPEHGVATDSVFRGINQIAIRDLGLDDITYHRYVAVVSCDRTLRLFSPDMREAAVQELPSAALSCCWVPTYPNLIVTGCQAGLIFAYDMRVLSRGPLQSTRIPFAPGSRPRPVHSLCSMRGLYGAPAGGILAGNDVRVGILRFTGLAGDISFSSFVDPMSCVTGVSAFERHVVVSHRNMTDPPASLTVHDRVFQSSAEVINLENTSEIVTPWSLGSNICGQPLRGHVQAVRPLNYATVVSSNRGRVMVVSSDDNAYGGRPGCRVWYSSASGAWSNDSVIAHDFGGHVRCIQATTPPRSVHSSPLVGVLSANRLAVFKTMLSD